MNDPNHYKFNGKERDVETGLDYFGARYYMLGRWMSPDWAAKPTAVPYANFGNPQSLNLNSFVGNNPATTFDLDGHVWGNQWGRGSLAAQGLANIDKMAAGIERAVVNKVATSQLSTLTSQLSARNFVATPTA